MEISALLVGRSKSCTLDWSDDFGDKILPLPEKKVSESGTARRTDAILGVGSGIEANAHSD